MISVSRTLLPPLEEYNKYLKRIWKSNWLTNNGELVQELEKKLQEYWGVKHVVCVDHGTSAIQIALRTLNAKEVYISPDNFIAVGAAAEWLGIKTKYVDDDEQFGSPAIVTHNYGIPRFTDTRPVIYDCSHAFSQKELFRIGDISVISFHAVKTFQTAEGGALVTDNDDIAEKARWMRNYGFKTRYTFSGIGTNFKMSEFHAAMGLASFPLIPKIVKRYAEIIDKYNKAFGYSYENVTYYPFWFSSEARLLSGIREFEENGIYPRRYFYPPLNQVYGGKSCPLTEQRIKRVVALPLYYELKNEEIDKIIQIAQKTR